MYKLVIGLSGTAVENDWNFWLYPATETEEAAHQIRITRSCDEALEAAAKGEKVLWIPLYNQLAWESPPIGRLPIFWNRLMGPKWDRFLGLVCDPKHPALALFVTDYYYDWQWEDVFRPACRAINMNKLPHELEPIVQMIDDWNRNDRLGAVFECRVGEGTLLVCAADLESNLDQRPVARQLRKSLLSYMESEKFDPKVEVSAGQLRGLLFDNQIMQKLGAQAQASSQDDRNTAANAIDGNPNTYWLTGRPGRGKGHPHDLMIQFAEPVAFTGLLWMNRQDHREHEGDICEYEIAVSEDGTAWTDVVRGRMESTFRPQRLEFGKTVTSRHLRIRAVSGFGPDTTASLAEVAVLLAQLAPAVPAGEGTEVYKKVQTATEEIFEGSNAPDQ
jgi:beta-galactosidase